MIQNRLARFYPVISNSAISISPIKNEFRDFRQTKSPAETEFCFFNLLSRYTRLYDSILSLCLARSTYALYQRKYHHLLFPTSQRTSRSALSLASAQTQRFYLPLCECCQVSRYNRASLPTKLCSIPNRRGRSVSTFYQTIEAEQTRE